MLQSFLIVFERGRHLAAPFRVVHRIERGSGLCYSKGIGVLWYAIALAFLSDLEFLCPFSEKNMNFSQY